MKIGLPALLCLFTASLALGNPIALSDPNAVYIAGEDLRIDLGEHAAEIQCQVLFKNDVSKVPKLKDPTTIWLPVWIPEDYETRQLKHLKKRESTWSGPDQKYVDEAMVRLCGLKISVNGVSVKDVTSFISPEWDHGYPLPTEAYPKGFRCVVFIFSLDAEEFRPVARVFMSWKQHHRKVSKRSKRFFYLPILPVRDSEASTSGSEGCFTRIRCVNGTEASLGWSSDATTIQGPAEATIPLHHLSPLKLTTFPAD